MTTDQSLLRQAADFASHRIEGFAHQGGHFSVDLFTHIAGNLWMGGCPVGDTAQTFDHIVNLYGKTNYDFRRGQTLLLHVMDDSIEQGLDRAKLHTLANMVIECMGNGPTLVHCQAGLNRSGLLTAFVLMLEYGMTDKQAVEILRAKRSDQVLCNQHFRRWLHDEQVRLRPDAPNESL